MTCFMDAMQHKVIFPSCPEEPVMEQFRPDRNQGPFPAGQPPEAVAAEECVDDEERRVRRRLSNPEAARRSRARKRRHLAELRDSAAMLQSGNGDLAARGEAARGRLTFTLLANSALRAEAAALSCRLAAARQALDVDRPLYGAGAGAAALSACSVDDGDCSRLGCTDIEEMIASLIAEPPY